METEEIAGREYTHEELSHMAFESVVEGICTACGEEAGDVEPDAENYPCEWCGENAVGSPLRILGYV